MSRVFDRKSTRGRGSDPFVGKCLRNPTVLFFRFGAALLLLVSVALTGTVLETQNLALKRSLSQQQYRMEVLLESQASLRLESQRLGTPAKLFDAMQNGDAALHRPPKPQRADLRRAPLLNWNHTPGNSSHEGPKMKILPE